MESSVSAEADAHAVWSVERIARFWDLVAGEPRLEHMYFAKQQGDCVVSFAQLVGLTGGQVLDYGCGAGFLAEELLRRGYETHAVEFSSASAARVNVRLAGKPRWHGCAIAEGVPTALPDAGFDFIFSVENYEHLRDEWVPGYFRELRRLLKPSGTLLLTTPNEEYLDDSLIICPCCETKFHRWGHLRARTAEQLADEVVEYGFSVEFCRPVNLRALRLPAPDPTRPARVGLPVRATRHLLRVVCSRRTKPTRPAVDWQLDSIPDGPHLVLIAS